MSAASVTLTVGDYVFYSIMGVLVVFFALTLLMAVIKIMTYQRKKPAADAPAETSSGNGGAVLAAASEDKELAPGTAGDLKLYDTDPRDAAMVMAIVADTLKKPLNELRFISIREVK